MWFSDISTPNIKLNIRVKKQLFSERSHQLYAKTVRCVSGKGHYGYAVAIYPERFVRKKPHHTLHKQGGFSAARGGSDDN